MDYEPIEVIDVSGEGGLEAMLDILLMAVVLTAWLVVWLASLVVRLFRG